jgi:hypothetical protein
MEKNKKIINRLILFFIIALIISGATAIPVETELSFLLSFFSLNSPISIWLQKVYDAFHEVNTTYPFLAYGYDWLAFAHFVLAILFIGPLKDPVKNKWVIEFAMIASILIIPFAFIAGSFRQIPLGWRLIDCSFGVLGLIPLWICKKKIELLEIQEKEELEKYDSIA